MYDCFGLHRLIGPLQCQMEGGSIQLEAKQLPALFASSTAFRFEAPRSLRRLVDKFRQRQCPQLLQILNLSACDASSMGHVISPKTARQYFHERISKNCCSFGNTIVKKYLATFVVYVLFAITTLFRSLQAPCGPITITFLFLRIFYGFLQSDSPPMFKQFEFSLNI